MTSCVTPHQLLYSYRQANLAREQPQGQGQGPQSEIQLFGISSSRSSVGSRAPVALGATSTSSSSSGGINISTLGASIFSSYDMSQRQQQQQQHYREQLSQLGSRSQPTLPHPLSQQQLQPQLQGSGPISPDDGLSSDLVASLMQRWDGAWETCRPVDIADSSLVFLLSR